MGNEWNQVQLGDVVEMQSKKIDAEAVNINNYISTENMLPNKEGIQTSSGLPNQTKYLEFIENDVLFSNIRTYFRKVWAAKFNGGASNDVIVFRTKNENVLNQSFLYYLLSDERFIEYTVATAKGTKMPRGDKSAINNYTFNLPEDIGIQIRVSSILGSLDKKIDLNRQMNQTLEEMSQALYKSWFVDFDPVIDNALEAGNTIPGELTIRATKRKELGEFRKPLPDSIKNLFPSEFEFCDELDRWIPKGWETKQLSDFIEIKHGYAFEGEYITTVPSDNILVTPGNFRIGGGFKSDKFKYFNGPIPEYYIFSANEMVVTMTDLSKQGDTLGYPAFIPHTKNRIYLHNQRIGRIIHKKSGLNNNVLYHFLCTPIYRNSILGSATGTTVRHTSPTKILENKILFSGGELEEHFDSIVKELKGKIDLNNTQIDSSTELRNTLLPKLISGELSVEKTHIKQ